jgi:TolB-like protein/Tfp pilus assembly protein PilF
VRKLFQELKRRNVIRVCAAYLAAAWVLLQVADVVVPVFDDAEWMLRALFYSTLLGFPMAAILAWFYELTPEGVKTAEEVEETEAAPFAGRKIDFIIIGLLVLAVGFLLVKDYSQPAKARSIAVLPFDNRSIGDAGAEFFADGIHEDLIVMLSKLSDIRVISRKSVEYFADANQSTRQIADALDVTTILEGGVRVAGNRVRINVQLIDAETDTDLWADTYDRELSTNNIFGIQSEVALNIVNELQATMSSDERKRLAVVPTQSLEAYEAYILGKREMARRTEPALQAAIEQFQRAIDLDENFALAHVGLADSYAIQENWGYVAQNIVAPFIQQSASRALELDGDLGEAYVSMATFHEIEDDYAAAESAYLRAIELRPGYATAHSWYSLLLRWRLGRFEDALRHSEQALTLDPLSPVLHMAYGDILFAQGRFDDAMSEYQRSIEIDPTFAGSKKMLGDLHLYGYRQMADALEWYRAAVAVQPDPDWVGDMAGIYMVLGDYDSANMWAGQAQRTDPGNIFVNKHLALLNYYQGMDDVAEEHARKYLEGPLDVFVPYMLAILRNGHLRVERFDQSRSMYEQAYPSLAVDDPVIHVTNYRPAIDLAAVLARMGELDRSAQLLSKSLMAIREMPRQGLFGYGSAEAEIYALQGRPSEALRALRAAVEDGWGQHWYFWTERNPNLDSIRSEPGYREIVTNLESQMANELAQLDTADPGPMNTSQ